MALARESSMSISIAAPPPLRFWQKAVFATGDVVDGGVNAALGTFLLFYLTAVCGMSGSLAGLALFVTLLVDSFVDPFVGYLSDSTRSRLGRRHPFLLGAALPLALMVALLFNIPGSLGGGGLFAYVVVILLLERVLQSNFLLPYAAMGAELSRDYSERSSVTAFRSLFNGLGSVMVISVGFGLFMRGPTGLLHRGAYVGFGWAAGLLVLVFALACAVGTLPLRSRLQVSVAERPPGARAFVREVGEAARNRTFMLLFATIIVFWVAQGTAGTLALYAYKYFWRLPNSFLQLLQVFAVIGALSGVPLSAAFLRRVAKQNVCIAGIVLFCLTQAVPPTMRIVGWLPAGGTGLFAFLCALAVVTAWAQTATGISFLSMMADATDEHEHLFGARREGLFFAGALFSSKASIAVGSLIGGVGLDLIGFPREVVRLGADPHIAAATVRNLGLITGPGAAAIAVLCVVFLTRYSLGSDRLAAIQADLAERRTEAQALTG